jgi:pimeloyl-ACP methyl ester carboxylesterase
MARVGEIVAPDGRLLRVYDTGDVETDNETMVIWHHGTPQSGQLPTPLDAAFRARRIRCVSYDRPGYRGSVRHHGRDVAAAAADVQVIADTLGIDRFATIGVSAGSPPALACAALLPGRVTCAVTVAGPAPFGAHGLDWFAGMADAVATRMRASIRSQAAIESHLRSVGYTVSGFTTSDLVALVGDWHWLTEDSQAAMAGGFPGVVDDILSIVAPWGFQPSDIAAPVLLIHGEDDRIVPSTHGHWLAQQLHNAQLWLRPDDGHIAVLNSCVAALDWLITHSD